VSKTPFFITIARPTYGAYLLRHNHIETIGREILSQIEGPFLIMGNHTHTLDALFVSAASPVHIRWVTGAHLFKLYGVKTMIAKWVTGISKKQGRSDFQTIKDISTALKNGDVVGLYPEGSRTWDGEPAGFDLATAKLVRMFKVPVVFFNLEGGYFLKPRWVKKSRKGTVTLRFLPPLMPDQIKTMKLAEIKEYLDRQIGFSHSEWQKRTHRSFTNSNKAEGLEQVLYMCPDCGARSSLETQKDLIRCNHCNMTVKLDAFECFTTIQGNNTFSDLPQWHAWETKELEKLVINAKNSAILFPPDRGVLLQFEHNEKLLTLSKNFEATLSKEAITLHQKDARENEDTLVLSFEDIQSMVVNAKSTLELYRGEELYRIRVEKNSSILKYIECYKLVRKQSQQAESEVDS
jgi:1-acyl-sn-glycerol-3-phosphate acyltransferase